MKDFFENGLKKLGIESTVQNYRHVAGGDINESYYVSTKEAQFFVKVNRQVQIQFFQFEAKGLEMIKNTNTIDVPNVYGVIEINGIPTLWMEWIEGRKIDSTDRLLGERLAKLHLTEGEGFGFNGTSFIGRLKQQDKIYDDWCEYYGDVRLQNQLDIGRSKRIIQGERERKLEKLLLNLDNWIPRKPKRSLLHGDLWGGNWMVGSEGNPYLIDPSVLYGDHEFELAFTELFGGFSSEFYRAYTEYFPLEDEYKYRKSLYQLFYLLVHLNMFGESYGRSVDNILSYYVG